MNKHQPLVSVVMSVYNGQEYLKEALDSILNQTFSDFEFIIINDGSTDNSLAIIQSYDDTRIKVIDQENHGLVYSLNRGCRQAIGLYIARMDADDISMPTRLEKELAAFMTQPGLKLVSTYFSYIDSQGTPTGSFVAMPTFDVDIKRALYIVNPLAHGSIMVLRSAWEDAGGYTDTYGPTEDYELWSRMLDDDSRSYIIPEPLYIYRLNPEGISASKHEVQQKFSEKIREERWKMPYIGKSVKDIIRDGKYYHSLPYPLGNEVFGAYYYQQLFIMQKLFKMKHYKTAIQHAFALYKLRPDWNRELLLKAVLGGFLRKVGVKK